MDHLTEVKIELLEKAYRRVDAFNPDHVNLGICYALSAEASKRQAEECTASNVGASFSAMKEICDYISRAMSPDIFYHAWLMHNHDLTGGLEGIKRGRLAWIDAMIAALREGRPLPDKPSLPSDYKPRPEPVAVRQFNI